MGRAVGTSCEARATNRPPLAADHGAVVERSRPQTQDAKHYGRQGQAVSGKDGRVPSVTDRGKTFRVRRYTVPRCTSWRRRSGSHSYRPWRKTLKALRPRWSRTPTNLGVRTNDATNRCEHVNFADDKKNSGHESYATNHQSNTGEQATISRATVVDETVEIVEVVRITPQTEPMRTREQSEAPEPNIREAKVFKAHAVPQRPV